METSTVYKSRLLRLAMFLDKLPPEKFKFSEWVSKTWAGKPDLSCGTTACGLGWASAMPEFQALGLHLTDAGLGVRVHPRLRGDTGSDLWAATCRATELIFGLTQRETDMLFVPTEDMNDDEEVTDPQELLDTDIEGSDGKLSQRATPQRLARHIRSFIELKYEEDQT